MYPVFVRQENILANIYAFMLELFLLIPLRTIPQRWKR